MFTLRTKFFMTSDIKANTFMQENEAPEYSSSDLIIPGNPPSSSDEKCVQRFINL